MKKIFISTAMGHDERLLAVADEDPQAAMFWPWLLCAMDDWGRASSNPRILKAQVVPSFPAITPELIGAWIAVYARHGLVTVYGPAIAVNGTAWRKYQTHVPAYRREKDGSAFPAPPDLARPSQTYLDLARSSQTYLDLARPLSPPLPSPLPPPLFPPPTPPPYNPPTITPSVSPSLPLETAFASAQAVSRQALADAPAVAPKQATKPVSKHPNFPYLEVFEEVLGTQATRTETRDRSLVANELREAGYTPAQCRDALEAWPVKWPAIHRTVRGLLRNMPALLAQQPAGIGSTQGRGSAAGASERWLRLVEDTDGQGKLPARHEQAVGELPLSRVQ